MFCFAGFTVHRNPENGGNRTYSTYEELELAFSKEELHPGDLKAAVEIYINKLLEPIRKKFEDPTLKKLTEIAYPSPSKQSKLSLCVQYRIPFIQLSWLLNCIQKVLELYPEVDSKIIIFCEFETDFPDTYLKDFELQSFHQSYPVCEFRSYSKMDAFNFLAFLKISIIFCIV